MWEITSSSFGCYCSVIAHYLHTWERVLTICICGRYFKFLWMLLLTVCKGEVENEEVRKVEVKKCCRRFSNWVSTQTARVAWATARVASLALLHFAFCSHKRPDPLHERPGHRTCVHTSIDLFFVVFCLPKMQNQADWQPGIQKGAADWDENWDKFEDEGNLKPRCASCCNSNELLPLPSFTFVKELTLDVENVVAPP
ncbi:hypothetical protein TEA_005077 [Camellia sinensis var. sinensis]|uniref:Uncharacterized protein n=1 Tax=Camellia sinensis var. sinensis TaxID=542762 RepID=A0A4S4DYK7_CAMSN|nr:hypothetical protein TEA_005077 [Camellia sinensis var. sinensis]